MSESQNIEWKETGRDEYLKWVCGFANPSIITGELANQLEITAKGIEWQISKLKKMGVLERIGPARGGYWKVVETKDE